MRANSLPGAQIYNRLVHGMGSSVTKCAHCQKVSRVIKLQARALARALARARASARASAQGLTPVRVHAHIAYKRSRVAHTPMRIRP
eukprot:6198962-Pleurochrysis_carterae.AAC.1